MFLYKKAQRFLALTGYEQVLGLMNVC